MILKISSTAAMAMALLSSFAVWSPTKLAVHAHRSFVDEVDDDVHDNNHDETSLQHHRRMKAVLSTKMNHHASRLLEDEDPRSQTMIRKVHTVYVANGRKAPGAVHARNFFLDDFADDDQDQDDAARRLNLFNQAVEQSSDVDIMTMMMVPPELVWKGDHILLVDVIGLNDSNQLQQILSKYVQGTSGTHPVEVTACTAYMCSVLLDMNFLDDIEALPEVLEIRPSLSTTSAHQDRTLQRTSPPPVPTGRIGHISEAVQALRVDLVQQKDPTLTGKGLRIGIISDSFAHLGNGRGDDANRDIISGDLPNLKRSRDQKGPSLFILKDMPLDIPRRDEGRAIAQLIHDLVPDAELYFHTSGSTIPNTAMAMLALADAGCHIIIDDVFYPAEHMFQDGVLAQISDDIAKERGIPYFSSIGNYGENSWTGTFQPSAQLDSFGCPFHDFGGSVFQEIHSARTSYMIFNWNDPAFSVSGPPGVTTDVNLFIYDENKTLIYVDAANNIGRDPLATGVLPSAGTFYLSIGVCPKQNSQQGAVDATAEKDPIVMKWVFIFGSLNPNAYTDEPMPVSSTSWGHANAPNVAGVGASHFFATPMYGVSPAVVTSFSGLGGTPVYMERDGTTLERPDVRKQPRFTAPDFCLNSFFGAFIQNGASNSPTGAGYFFVGTSAAAPNAAAVAGLLLQANPTLTPQEIYTAMEETAIDMIGSGFDHLSGHGFLDANEAVTRVIVDDCGSISASKCTPPTADNLSFLSRSLSSIAMKASSAAVMKSADASSPNERVLGSSSSSGTRRSKKASKSLRDHAVKELPPLVHVPICLFDNDSGDYETLCMDVKVVAILPEDAYRCGCCELGHALCN